MSYRVGDRIQITTNDGRYVGVLHSTNKQLGRLTLHSVVCIDAGKKCEGILHFFDKEIFDVTVVKEKKPEATVASKQESGRSLFAPKLKCPHLGALRNYDRNECLLANVLSDDEKSTHHGRGSSPDGGVGQAAAQRSPESGTSQGRTLKIDYTVIDCYGDAFNEAIEHIQAQNLIGLSAEAIDMGRNGCLCWLAIATQDERYIFDMIQLDDSSFRKGLTSILQSGKIQKVVHDCRRLSDLLFHKYQTDLVNVFDTQVAHVTIYRNKTGQYPRYVESLASLLLNMLNVDPSLVHVSKIRMSHALDDQQVWCHRPATQTMLQAVTKNVMHLLRLRHVLLEKMLADFVDGVNIYLSCLRDTENQDVPISQMSSQHTLPSEFARLQMKHSSSRKTGSAYDKNGFRQNVTRDPQLLIAKRQSSKGLSQYMQGRANQKEAKPNGRSDASAKQINGGSFDSHSSGKEDLTWSDSSDRRLSPRSDECSSSLTMKSLKHSMQQIARSTQASRVTERSSNLNLIAAGSEASQRTEKKLNSASDAGKLIGSQKMPLLLGLTKEFDCIPSSVGADVLDRWRLWDSGGNHDARNTSEDGQLELVTDVESVQHNLEVRDNQNNSSSLDQSFDDMCLGCAPTSGGNEGHSSSISLGRGRQRMNEPIARPIMGSDMPDSKWQDSISLRGELSNPSAGHVSSPYQVIFGRGRATIVNEPASKVGRHSLNMNSSTSATGALSFSHGRLMTNCNPVSDQK